MSEELSGNEQQADNSQKEEETPVDRDGYLALLIHLVEGIEKDGSAPEDEAVEVTLNVGGLLITGTIISRDAFIEGVELLRNLFGAAEKGMSEEEKKAMTPGSSRHFIHLKDARFIFPNSDALPQNQGIYWRGRLNRVDGWTLGRMESVRGRP